MFLQSYSTSKCVFCAGLPGVHNKTCPTATQNLARPDFAELDVFLGQHILLTTKHILLTLEQHFNPKM